MRTRCLLLRTLLPLSLGLGAAGVAADLTPWAGAPGAQPLLPWRFAGLPAQTLPRTRYSLVESDGALSLRIEARASCSRWLAVRSSAWRPAR